MAWPYLKETLRHIRLNQNTIGNFFNLFLVKLLDLFIFLGITPFLIARLGIENFGVLNVAQAAFAFFIVATDYGFNITATRFVSLHRHDKEALRLCLGRVLTVKILLILVCAVVLVALTLSLDPFEEYQWLYWLGYLYVIGQTLQPIWFFQGLEKMRQMALMNVATKAAYFLAVVTLIRAADDYQLVLFLLGAANLIVAVVTWWSILRGYGIAVEAKNLGSYTLGVLREDFGVVSSNFSIAVYTSANIIILDRFADSYVVGYYSLIEKVIRVVMVVLTVFSTVIYPRLCALTTEGYETMRHWLNMTFRIFAAGVCGVLVLMALFSGQILAFFAKDQVLPSEAYGVFRLMLLAPLIVMLNIPAYQTLLAYNEKKAYSSILISSAVISVCLALSLVPLFSVWGMVATVILTSAYSTIGLHYMARVKVASRFALAGQGAASNR